MLCNNSFSMLVVALLAVVAVASAAEEKFTTKFDKVDVESIVKNDRLVEQYFKCLMEVKGAHCTPEGAELKKDLPDALQNDCAKCSAKQKEQAEKWILWFLKNKKDLFAQLEKKYDANGVYRKKYEAKIKNA